MSSPTTDQIAAEAKKGAQALAASLVSLLKLSQADAEAFAAKYATAAVQWGIDLAQAKQLGNAEDVVRLEEDFNELAINAGAMAAELAIDAQAETEATVKAILMTAANFAVAALAVA